MSIHSSVQNGTSEKAIETVRPEPALERSQTVHLSYPRFSAPRPLPTAATSLPIGAFSTTLTTLSLSLMEWRGVTTTNVYIANFFFLAAFGLFISAQWELTGGNGFGYSVFSAFGLFYAGYGAILTPSFGVAAAYGDDTKQLNNALGLFMITDGHATAAVGLKKSGGVFAFLAGLVGWYLTFHLLLKDSLVELPLGDTSQYFPKTRKKVE
ncbi:hypothetical protein COL154_013123 [Colletotrichum chrysophilum]|nr:hypothetical protein KNSL1_012873 [Colletotrichum chrysophilum]KAJ0350895.1 hypothetical protein COL154_013123 [Colletotrichum chrysophilum]